VLSPRFVGAHGVWLDDDELALVREHDAALVHCPGANLKLGSGIARVRAWRDAGVKRGLGCDGVACSNRFDAVHELGLAGALSHVRDPERPLAPRDALALATCEGARALGLGDVTGALVAGRAADLVVFDHTGPHHGPDPEADPYTAIVHSGRAADVRVTMAAGRVLYEDGRWSTLDVPALLADARGERRGLVRRAGITA